MLISTSFQNMVAFNYFLNISPGTTALCFRIQYILYFKTLRKTSKYIVGHQQRYPPSVRHQGLQLSEEVKPFEEFGVTTKT